jgi:hypothetical protein
MNGIELITEERERQIRQEGWTAEHDAKHSTGDIALAASGYAWPRWFSDPRISEPINWPRDWEFKSETRQLQSKGMDSTRSRVRDLVKAGALIAAEIDRLTRTPQAEEEKD